MRRFFRNNFLLSLILAVPLTVQAYSGIKDADAVVTVKNGKPCFSYTLDEETSRRPYRFSFMTVAENGPAGKSVWELKSSAIEPSSVATCIEYGGSQPLQIKTPYNVHLVVGANVDGAAYEWKYHSDFCIVSDGKSLPVVTAAYFDKQWQCSEPAKPPKRGFWQRLFNRT
jgi:hypothetical protein